MLVIGLTGGIASGKTTVAKLLSQHGATIIDADLLGHEIYQPHRPAWQSMVDAFGPEIVGPDGFIDRRRLGSLVFGDPEAMHRLTSIVWPAMKAEMGDRLKELRASGARIVVLEAAVLIEAAWQDLVDEVWVAVVPPAVAVARLIQRNGLTEAEAEARLAAQMRNSERVAYADVVIDNSGDIEELTERVEALWEQLLQRAA